MNAATLRSVALITAAALATSGCETVSTEESTGVFSGANAASAGSSITRGASVTTGESQSTGFSSGAVITATVTVIGKYQASVRQQKIAEQRARAAVARIQAQQREQERREAQATAAKPGVKKPKTTIAARRRVPRYICVDTVKDERTSVKAEKAVVIWDTQSQEIVGNNVYDVATVPTIGSTAKFETYSAEYVGGGG